MRSVELRHFVAAALIATVPACTSTERDERLGDTQLALAAAVRVEADGCQTVASIGAGSFVAEGLVVTVAHVVAGSAVPLAIFLKTVAFGGFYTLLYLLLAIAVFSGKEL